jgi:NAD(P)-dependent dehydrogenase (short-subunit alcohol dehydrogenase family)
MKERDVRDKNFVFIGGSHGMGRAAARALAERGASVLIVARGAEAGEAAAREALGVGAASGSFIEADLSTVEGTRRAAEGIKARAPEIHGLMHTAMSPFRQRKITEDGLEFAFALQYFARAALNRLLRDNLAASGDGRIVHVAGNVSPGMAKVDLDDLQFENRKWTFFRAILGTHHLGFLHLQEAARRWEELPICATAFCVNSVKTKVMLDREMPLIMRLMGRLGSSPEKAVGNAITLLTKADNSDIGNVICRKPGRFEPEPFNLDVDEARRLWDITTRIGEERNLSLP